MMKFQTINWRISQTQVIDIISKNLMLKQNFLSIFIGILYIKNK